MNQEELYSHLDEEHIEALDHRVCELRDALIKRGKDPDKAVKIASRFADIELKIKIRWD